MTLNDFVVKYNGRYIDFDGAYGNQCFDLLHEYCVEVLGLADGKILSAPYAKDIFNNFEQLTGHDLFNKIPNTADGVPQIGDIMVWGMAPYGHVAIFVEGNALTFNSFDQNYPTGTPCHVQNHNYTNVLGWLRFKISETVSKETYDACMVDRKKFWEERDAGLAKITELEKKTVDLNRQLAEIANIMESIKNEDADAIQNMHLAQKELEKYQKVLNDCLGELELPTEDIQSLPGSIHSLEQECLRLEGVNETLKEDVTQLQLKLKVKCPSFIEQLLSLFRK